MPTDRSTPRRAVRAALLVLTLVPLLGGCTLLAARGASEFSISLDTDALTIAPAGSDQVQVTIDYLTGVEVLPVTLRLISPAPGIRADEVTVPIGGDQGALTVEVDAGVTETTYTLTIQASNAVVTKQAQLELDVVSP